MNPFAETRSQSPAQADRRFSVFIAQMIGGGERLAPAALFIVIEQSKLVFLRDKRRGVDSQQTNGLPALPVIAKQASHLLEYFSIELRGTGKRMGAGDSAEVAIAQLQLHGARV